jgi:uncharacterized protein (TIGR02996 family)
MDLVQPFLDSIRENPADPSLWLILGDWLEEREDPRAELVRLTLSLRTEPKHRDFKKRQASVQALLAGGMKPLVPGFTNSIGIELALIPAGSFVMGAGRTDRDKEQDEQPAHPVQLTRSFFLGTTAVTQRQYRKLIGSNPAQFNSRRMGGVDHPVEQVSHVQALRFCQLLSARPEEQAAGRNYRLPTEAEWEYACRAGTTTRYHFGNTATWRDARMDVKDEPDVPPTETVLHTVPVGRYTPNAWGLYDMHGNVWEWCADRFRSYTKTPQVDPVGPPSAEFRVIRGGSWNSYPRWCRSCRRSNHHDDAEDNDIGFRIACDVVPREVGERGASAP